MGVTRAKRRLTLTLALSRQKWGKPRPTIPSRFLYEMTGQAKNPNLPGRQAAAAAARQGCPSPPGKKPLPVKRPIKKPPGPIGSGPTARRKEVCTMNTNHERRVLAEGKYLALPRWPNRAGNGLNG